jgi:hypothetical protein
MTPPVWTGGVVTITLNGVVQTDGRDYELAVVASEVLAVVMKFK